VGDVDHTLRFRRLLARYHLRDLVLFVSPDVAERIPAADLEHVDGLEVRHHDVLARGTYLLLPRYEARPKGRVVPIEELVARLAALMPPGARGA
jgi:hypothetical protein